MSTRLSIPLEELGSRLSKIELEAWRVYLSEPRDDRRHDYHAALITKAVYDFMGALGGSKRDLPLENYLLKFTSGEESNKASINNILALFGKHIPDTAKEKMRSIQ